MGNIDCPGCWYSLNTWVQNQQLWHIRPAYNSPHRPTCDEPLLRWLPGLGFLASQLVGIRSYLFISSSQVKQFFDAYLAQENMFALAGVYVNYFFSIDFNCFVAADTNDVAFRFSKDWGFFAHGSLSEKDNSSQKYSTA